MRIGYSFWGFLADYKEDQTGKELSTPDGNAAYSWSVIWEAQRKGHEVFLMQEDRDWPAFSRRGVNNFASFSQTKRLSSYLTLNYTITPDIPGRHSKKLPLPDLDVLLVEWRWPIPGRNFDVDKDSLDYQPDYDRQRELIEHYRSTHTKIVIWDLDHKLTANEEIWTGASAIFETSVTPLKLFQERVRVEPPIPVSDLLQHTPKALNASRKLVYVGSRYERDDVIEEWIRPVSNRFKGEVHFYGNWDKPETLKQCRKMWPDIEYHGRISMKDFYSVYGDAVACPLLAKKSYLEVGFITPRIWEALIFGTIPVGLQTHHGIDQYLPSTLIARDSKDLGDIVEWLSRETASSRQNIRESIAKQIHFMDSKYFIEKLESAVQGTENVQ